MVRDISGHTAKVSVRGLSGTADLRWRQAVTAGLPAGVARPRHSRGAAQYDRAAADQWRVSQNRRAAAIVRAAVSSAQPRDVRRSTVTSSDLTAIRARR